MFPITSPFDVLVEFLLEILLELGTKVGWMKEDCMCEFALWYDIEISMSKNNGDG